MWHNEISRYWNVDDQERLHRVGRWVKIDQGRCTFYKYEVLGVESTVVESFRKDYRDLLYLETREKTLLQNCMYVKWEVGTVWHNKDKNVNDNRR